MEVFGGRFCSLLVNFGAFRVLCTLVVLIRFWQASSSILCGTVTPCLLLYAALSQLVRCHFCVNVWTAVSVPLTCLGGIFALVRAVTLFLPLSFAPALASGGGILAGLSSCLL